jgi:succinate dehydrogenase hydrophobic anchor subunit
MDTIMLKSESQGGLLSLLEKIPQVSFYARTRGWPYVISMGHRITGIIAVLFVCLYLYTVTSTEIPGSFGLNFPVSRWAVFPLFIWLMAVPIIFHSFNGARLLLYELFGKRSEERMLRWTFVLSGIYLACLGLVMLLGDQFIAPFSFWLVMLICGSVSGYVVGAKIWATGHHTLWKLQRISGAFLLVMVPAYVFFLQLDPATSSEINPLVLWLYRYLIKFTYVVIMAAILFHGGYGVWSVIVDYLHKKILTIGLGVLIALVMLFFYWIGLNVVHEI